MAMGITQHRTDLWDQTDKLNQMTSAADNQTAYTPTYTAQQSGPRYSGIKNELGTLNGNYRNMLGKLNEDYRNVQNVQPGYSNADFETRYNLSVLQNALNDYLGRQNSGLQNLPLTGGRDINGVQKLPWTGGQDINGMQKLPWTGGQDNGLQNIRNGFTGGYYNKPAWRLY